MKTQESKENDKQGCCAEFMSNLNGFQGMSEMMKKCCPDMGDSEDCVSMMKSMMAKCGQTKERDSNDV